MKNVVITGSTRGIGLAMAMECLRAGCHVTLSGRGAAPGEAAAAALAPFGDQFIYYPCEVQSREGRLALHDGGHAQEEAD